MNQLIVTSPCFEEGGLIPLANTGYGTDLSPELHLQGHILQQGLLTGHYR